MLDGPVGKKLLDKLPEKGLVGLGLHGAGLSQHHQQQAAGAQARGHPGPEDPHASRIPLYIDMLNALGANAVPMPFPELYTALESKAVDGQENPYATVEASKFYEVQKYFSTTRHIYNPQMMLVSKKFWDQLSADEKKILQDAANEARDYQRKVAREMDEKSRQTLIKTRACRSTTSAPPELARMRDKVKPVIDKHRQTTGELGKEMTAEVERIRAGK